MASRRELEIGIRIGATDDGATDVIRGIVSGANNSMRTLVGGLAGLGIGSYAARIASTINDAYAGQEYSFANLRILEMNQLGKVNEEVYGKEEQYIKDLSNRYAKSVEEYTQMAIVFRQNRISSDDFLGGIGESGAELAKVFDNMDPKNAALFFSRIKNDLRVSADEMETMANMLFKLKNVGVGGGDANLSVHELTEAYSKAGLGAVNLGLKGAKDAEELGVLMGTFIAKGITGQTTGNNFRRIFDGLRDPDRVGKVIAKGAEYGVKLSFYDSDGKFRGIQHFEDELKKVGKLSIQQRAEILKPFSGKQGLSTDFLEYLSVFGEDVEEIKKQYDDLPELKSALGELLGTQTILTAKTKSAKENMQAAFGKTVSEDVKRFNEMLTDTYHFITDIVSEHEGLARVTLELGGMAAAGVALYSGLRLAGAYIPVLSGLAPGLISAFGPLLGIAAAFMVLKEGADYAGKKAAQDPNSKFGKNIGYFQGKIDENDSAEGIGSVLNSAYWRFRKSSHGFTRGVFGEDFYNSSLVSNDEQYDNSPAGLEYRRKHFMGMSSMAESQGWNKPQYNYSPNLVVNGGGLSKEDFEKLAAQNSVAFMDSIQKEMKRQENLKYGKRD